MSEFLKDRAELADTVRQIVADVGRRGDAAVAQYTERFDKIALLPQEFRIPQEALAAAHAQLDTALLNTLRKAIANIRRYQSEIFIGDKNTHPGIRYTPLNRVGLCIPGASAPLPSTVMMTAIPAQVAGVREVVVVSPRWNG